MLLADLDLRYRQRGLLRGEVPIQKSELDQLRKVQRAHDHYLRSLTILATGSEAMRGEASKGSEFAKGWLACLRLLHGTISGQVVGTSDQGD